MTDASFPFPPELRAFLFSCIDSPEQVELLVALARSGHARTTRDIGGELGIAEGPTRRHLEILKARGLLTARAGDEVAYRYEPRTDALAGYTDLLLEHYEAARIDVLTFVTAQSRSGLKRFSDAFKLREEDRQ